MAEKEAELTTHKTHGKLSLSFFRARFQYFLVKKLKIKKQKEKISLIFVCVCVIFGRIDRLGACVCVCDLFLMRPHANIYSIHTGFICFFRFSPSRSSHRCVSCLCVIHLLYICSFVRISAEIHNNAMQ